MPVPALPEPQICARTALQEKFGAIACLAAVSVSHSGAQLSLQIVHAAMQEPGACWLGAG